MQQTLGELGIGNLSLLRQPANQARLASRKPGTRAPARELECNHTQP